MLFAIKFIVSSMILELYTGLGFFLNMICSQEFMRGIRSFIFIVQVCRSRTIGNRHQCVKQTIKYIEQRDLLRCKRSHGLQMEECYM